METNYLGNRPNLNWIAFLIHLKQKGYSFSPRIRSTCHGVKKQNASKALVSVA